ncbi:MAG: hypothetical protein KDD70_03805 [Bdellovibrionales bacterium]|nr:hypothetical protein [Bdellovibrionales bacterium]
MLPNHFYHPFIVHVPIVLPFVGLGLLVWWSEKVSDHKGELISLFAIQLFFAFAAFYSGSFAGEPVVEKLSPAAHSVYDWHYTFGRLTIFASAIALAGVSIATVATQKKRAFYGVAVLCSLLLCVLVILSGFTGGSLIHEYGINELVGNGGHL